MPRFALLCLTSTLLPFILSGAPASPADPKNPEFPRLLTIGEIPSPTTNAKLLNPGWSGTVSPTDRTVFGIIFHPLAPGAIIPHHTATSSSGNWTLTFLTSLPNAEGYVMRVETYESPVESADDTFEIDDTRVKAVNAEVSKISSLKFCNQVSDITELAIGIPQIRRAGNRFTITCSGRIQPGTHAVYGLLLQKADDDPEITVKPGKPTAGGADFEVEFTQVKRGRYKLRVRPVNGDCKRAPEIIIKEKDFDMAP